MISLSCQQLSLSCQHVEEGILRFPQKFQEHLRNSYSHIHIKQYVDELVTYVKAHITGTYGDMIPLQISAHLLSRLAAVQDVLKLNSGTELLHAFQSARAELSSTGPAPFDQFVSLIPQDKRGDVLRGGRGRWTYDYVMQEIDHLIQMSSRMSPRMSSLMSPRLNLNPSFPKPRRQEPLLVLLV